MDWATNPAKWQQLWGRPPIQFWYLYPSGNVATAEFHTKWRQFLPRNEYKDHSVYGWREELKKGDIYAIHFNSGVILYFKTYGQEAQNLQTGTVDAIFCDEELPVALYDELSFRLSASSGYFHMVFTATLGQRFWWDVIEERGTGSELLPQAAKWQVSMFDCMVYDDGTPSHWTYEKIQEAINKCSTKNEMLKRIYGRFVSDTGLKYEQFDRKRHMVKAFPIPEDWYKYAAVDLGGGGEGKHPAAVCFIAVRPDFRFGCTFKGWRGDHERTVASDVMTKFLELKGKMQLYGQAYDWSSGDFQEIAVRTGEPFQKAEKGHEIGEKTINSLFKHDMMVIFEDPELEKLAKELSSLKKTTAKRSAKDDIADAFRYAVVQPPWDWSFITGEKSTWAPNPEPKLLSAEEAEKAALAAQIQERREEFDESKRALEAVQSVQDEFNEWNELHGN